MSSGCIGALLRFVGAVDFSCMIATFPDFGLQSFVPCGWAAFETTAMHCHHAGALCIAAGLCGVQVLVTACCDHSCLGRTSAAHPTLPALIPDVCGCSSSNRLSWCAVKRFAGDDRGVPVRRADGHDPVTSWWATPREAIRGCRCAVRLRYVRRR